MRGTDMGISDAARKLGESFGDLRRALNDKRQDVVTPASRFIQDQPLAALAIAFGAGYFLGGGLFTRTTGRLIGAGWKLGGMALARNLLANLGGPSMGLTGEEE